MKQKVGFGNYGIPAKMPYNEYSGKYIVVTTASGETVSGRYAGVSRDGNMILNPHQTFSWSGLGVRKELSNDNREISPTHIKDITPTTLENLTSYFSHSNAREVMDETKRQKEYLENCRNLSNELFRLGGLK